MGVIGVIGVMGRKHKTQTSPAQRDSAANAVSNLGMGLIGPMGPIGLMDKKSVTKNRPAQLDTGISILKTSPYRPYCPYRPLVLKTTPAQQDSKMSNLNGINDEIITIQIENKTGCLTCGWDYEKQNGPAQRDSKMSNLKIETENSFPQRHSKMSNGRLSGLLCWPHGQKAIPTMKVKNTRCLFMGRKQMLVSYDGSLKVA
jgi:hypothetical protein